MEYTTEQYERRLNAAIADLTSVSAKLAQVEKKCDLLKEQVRNFETWGIIEVASRNPNVASYMNEWEVRATKAEEALALHSAPVSDEEAEKVWAKVSCDPWQMQACLDALITNRRQHNDALKQESHLESASERVSKWPDWKRNLFNYRPQTQAKRFKKCSYCNHDMDYHTTDGCNHAGAWSGLTCGCTNQLGGK